MGMLKMNGFIDLLSDTKWRSLPQTNIVEVNHQSRMNNNISPTRHVNFILLGFPNHHPPQKKKTSQNSKKKCVCLRHLPSFHIPNSNFTPCHPCHLSILFPGLVVSPFPLSTDQIHDPKNLRIHNCWRWLTSPHEIWKTMRNSSKSSKNWVKSINQSSSPNCFCEVNICFKKSIELPPFSTKKVKIGPKSVIPIDNRYQVAEIREGHFAWSKVTFQAIQVHLNCRHGWVRSGWREGFGGQRKTTKNP